MNWRSVQLGDDSCDQDNIIKELIDNRPVLIHGRDHGFSRMVKIDDKSETCLIFFNEPLWLSTIRDRCSLYLSQDIKHCYISINRCKGDRVRCRP